MARKPVRKAPARRAPPAPATHLPGPRTPDSAASVSPPPVSGLESFTAATRDSAIEAGEGLGADPELSPAFSGVAQDEETLEQRVARIRAMRAPMGMSKQKLAYPKRQGYYRHWFNDSPGRIDDAIASGWAHVRDKDGKSVRRNVDRGRDNAGQDGFLMELPEEIWLDDMAARHKDAQGRMDEIKQAPFKARPGEAKPSDQGKFYSPTDSEPVKIGSSLVKG